MPRFFRLLCGLTLALTVACSGGTPSSPTCTDAVKNGTESDVDCGGPCAACAAGKACGSATDCVSGACEGGVCVTATCTDAAKNGTESDVDCGGSSCPPCTETKGCSGALDCASRVCQSHACVAPSCSDGTQNGTESDVDCGGSCTPCATGKLCAVATDCAQQACTNRVCQAAACVDGAKNGTETDTDCGGAACPKCAATKVCTGATDCLSALCTGGHCAASSCTDQVKNGAETDTDCGGGTCPGCATSKACVAGTDCASSVCTSQACVAAACGDGVRNGAETDVDCGGGTCPACAPTKTCTVAADCGSRVCTTGTCRAPSCSDTTQNGSESAVDCGGATCAGCADGLACVAATDCASGVCTGLVCRAGSCTDGVKNGAEIGIDCGGTCGLCSAGATCGSSADCLSGRCLMGVCNPDPSLLAPPLPRGVGATPGLSTRFLYTGPNALQLGVDAGVIDAAHAAVLRGRVVDRSGAALGDVQVSAPSAPELGKTFTRADGAFDFVVNGGGPVTLAFARSGYLPAQRQVKTFWGEFSALPDVALVALDTKVTVVDLASLTTVAAAQGSPVVDADGTRTATMMFAPGTTATLQLPDGGAQAVSTIRVRATEYTKGLNGQAAMPATLPRQSGYTWCAELSLDEALAADATGVQFNQPVPVYVDNFLGFPVGGVAPVGTYDRTTGRWVALPNGRVIQILAAPGGVADLDVDGTGAVAGAGALAALGITPQERTTLASAYPVGASLWRVRVDHFTPVDVNWPYSPPPGAGPPPKLPPPPKPGLPCERSGSVVACEDQSLGESLSLTGVPFALHYQSKRVPGRTEAYSVTIPVTGATLPPGVLRVELEAQVAGQQIRRTFAPVPNQSFTFTWNGKDAYGREALGRQTVVGRTGFAYTAVYQSPGAAYQRAFAEFSGFALSSNRNRTGGDVVLWQDWTRDVGAPAGPDLGGWWLGPHHEFLPGDGIVALGTGRIREAHSINAVLTTVIGTGVPGFNGDGLPGNQTNVGSPHMAKLLRDGSIVVVDYYNHRLRKIRPDGIVTTIAGNGTQGTAGDNGPATLAQLDRPHTLAVGPDDSLIFSEPFSYRIRRITPDGIIRTIAGNGTPGFSGDDGPATSAQLNMAYMLDVASDGTVYFGDAVNNRIRKVTPEGIITTIAGTGVGGYNGDGIPAISAQINGPTGVAVEPNGSILISEYYNHRIRRIGLDGIITTAVGTGVSGYTGDGAAATLARIDRPHQVNVARDGTLYLVQYLQDFVIRRVTPDGIITTIAGNGTAGLAAEGVAAAGAPLNGPHGASPALDGSILFADLNNQRVKRISAPVAGTRQGDVVVPSEDGDSLFVFDTFGRHLRTLNALTGAPEWSFTYDTSGRLGTVVDGAGNVTTIERNAMGKPTAIVAPGGQRTVLTLDSYGWLASVSDPAMNRYELAHGATGLLGELKDPRGNTHVYAYDADGRLQLDTSPGGVSIALARVTTAGGVRVSATNALGEVELFDTAQDVNGDVSRGVTSTAGAIGTAAFTERGTASRTRPDGVTETVTEAPDPRFGMQAPLSATRIQQTPGGRISTTTMTRTVTAGSSSDPTTVATQTDIEVVNGRTITRTFIADAGTLTQVSPEGRTAVTSFDAVGRTVAQLPAGSSLAMTFTYDAKGRLGRVARGTESTVITYDALNRPDSRTDAAGHVTRLTYDAADRVSRLTLADLRVWNFGYDANGNRTSVTSPSGAVHTFAFDADNRLSAYTPPGATTPATFTYDLAGRLTSLKASSARTTTRTYDVAGRLATLSGPEATVTLGYVGATSRTGSLVRAPATGPLQRLTFTYDGPLVTSYAFSGAANGTYTLRYDDNFMLVGLKLDALPEVALVRDRDGHVTTHGPFTFVRNGPAGAATRISDTAVTADISYDAMGREAVRTLTIGGTQRHRLALTYGSTGNIATADENVAGTTRALAYSYDPVGQLTGVTVGGSSAETYAYDQDGHRTARDTETATFTAGGLLATRGAVTYTFNADGQLTNRGTDTFSYGVAGELLSATVGGATVTYAYDGMGRRVARTDGTGTTQYLYGTGHPYELTHSRDSANVLTAYFYDEAGRLFSLERSGARFYVATDANGQPRAVFDSTGATVKLITRDAYGRRLTDSNPGFVLELDIAGGLRDPLTGLVRLGVRDYEPESGRFTARDPALFAGAQGDLYAYGGSDPVNHTDPSGLGDSTRENLEGLVKSYTQTLADEGRRIDPSWGDGYIVGMVNNLKAKSGERPDWEQCVGQSADFMNRHGWDLAQQGFKSELFDTTKKTDTSGGVEHQFVKVTAPDGKEYQVDPWLNRVLPFDPNKYTGSKGVKTETTIRPTKPKKRSCPR